MNKLIEVTRKDFVNYILIKDGYNNVPLLIEYIKLNHFPSSIIQMLENTPLTEFVDGLKLYCALDKQFFFISPFITVYTEPLFDVVCNVSSLFVEYVRKNQVQINLADTFLIEQEKTQQNKAQLDDMLKSLLTKEEYGLIEINRFYQHIDKLPKTPKNTITTYNFLLYYGS